MRNKLGSKGGGSGGKNLCSKKIAVRFLKRTCFAYENAEGEGGATELRLANEGAARMGLHLFVFWCLSIGVMSAIDNLRGYSEMKLKRKGT